VQLTGNGSSSNRDAIGAWVRCVFPNGRVVHRQVMPTRSYLSQVERAVTIGFGSDETTPTLTVTWPDGVVEAYPVDDAAATGVLEITQR